MLDKRSCGVVLGIATTTVLVGVALADQPAQHGGGRNIDDMSLAPVPGLPTCGTGAVEHGDPSKGPSVLVSRMTAGCAIPWHWHTPNEHVMVVNGTLRMEMKDSAQPIVLKAGGYALMPSHHIHQARCVKACTLFVYSDDKFDIHYVDAQGNEIKPEQALESVRETVATR